jgi:acyl-coenzyme A synthetase/AMP-(fatty) acid ligase
MHKYDLSSLKHLFLAGEPLDQPTHEWIMGELGLPVIDNYWQTETGWPILSAMPGVEKTEIRFGTPSFPVYGYNLKIFREDGTICDPDEKGIVGILPPLPPGCLSTVWGDDALCLDLLLAVPRAAGLLLVRLGDQGQGRLSLHPRPHRRRDQRRRPPPGDA